MSKDIDDKIYINEPKCYVSMWHKIRLDLDNPQILNYVIADVTTELEMAIHNINIDAARHYEIDKNAPKTKIIKELYKQDLEAKDHPDDLVYLTQYAYTRDHQDFAVSFAIYERDLIGGNPYE